MAIGQGHVFDQYRCAEVYEALDEGCYELAVMKADVLLRQGRLPLARTLKAYALLRLGCADEAAREADAVLAQRMDAGVLPVLETVLLRLGKREQLANLFLGASQAMPHDASLAENALLALIKAGLFQRALQMLMKRVRASRTSKDLWRYVQVALLHSQRLAPPGSKLTIEVALRLLHEQPLDPNAFTEETLALYLRFLLAAGRPRLDAAAALLDQPPVARLADKSLGVQFLLRECWDVQENTARILDDCRTRIECGDRNWAVLSLFIVTMARVARGTLDARHVKVVVHAAECDQWADRGSFLGVLELCRQAAAHALTPPAFDYPALVHDYFARFGSKPACFDDIYPYLAQLSDAQRSALLSAVRSSDAPLTSEAGIVRRINAEKLAFVLAPPTRDSAFETAAVLLDAYATSLKHCHLPETEMQTGDDLALLAIHAVLCTAPPDDAAALCTAAAIAAYACGESARGYRLRLVLIRLLVRLGATKLAVPEYNALLLKSVQLETASHYLLDRNAAFGGATAVHVAAQWDRMHEFYATSAMELPQTIGQAFANGKFSQVADMCAFSECLERSCTRALIQIDSIRGKLANQDLVDEEWQAARRQAEALLALVRDGHVSDQRDETLIPCFDEAQCSAFRAALACGPKREQAWIAAMLEVLSLALDLAPPPEGALDELTAAERALVALVRALRADDDAHAAVGTFAEAVRRAADEAPTPFDVLHAAWVGVEGMNVWEACAQRAGVDAVKVFAHAQLALHGIKQRVDEAQQAPPHEVRLGGVPQAHDFACQVAEARRDALKEAARPYAAFLHRLS